MECKQLSLLFVVSLVMQALVVPFVKADTKDTQVNKPEVVFETSKGGFTLQLDPVKAPKTVKNFLRYVDEGFYDNTIFHRAIPGFVVQGGGFEKGMKYKKPYKPVKNESANGVKNSRGSISMARRSHPDTATSQFYINLNENTRLDYKSKVQPGYTVFGKISDGMDVIDKIADLPTHTVESFRDVPKENVYIISAKRKNSINSDVDVKNKQASDFRMQRYIPGEHYVVLDKPVPTRDSSKIEVIEMFSYGCPHCYEFEPKIKQWSKQQASNVDFWFFPAVWNKSMSLYARAFYTAKALNVEDKIHLPLFKAIVVKQEQIKNQQDIANFFSRYGVDKKMFEITFNSKAVVDQAKQAKQRVGNYKPVGVPEIIVNGKYRIGRMRAGGMEEMLAVADYLINKETAMLAKEVSLNK